MVREGGGRITRRSTLEVESEPRDVKSKDPRVGDVAGDRDGGHQIDTSCHALDLEEGGELVSC